MSFNVVRAVLASAIATSGTLTLTYPSGTSRGNFLFGARHRMVWAGTVYEAPKDFTLTLNANASGITFTWLGATTLPVGAELLFELDKTGANFPDNGLAGLNRVVPAQTLWVDIGSPVVAAAAALRAAASISGAGALTLLATTLDVPRNITFTSSGNDSGITFTILSKDEYGATVTEVVTGANAGVASGTKAHKTLTSITSSGASAGTVSVGYGTVLGLPVFIASAGRILFEFLNNAALASVTATVVAGVTTTPSGTTGDVRGTVVPASAPDGSKQYAYLVALGSPTYLGAPQFAG